MTLNTKHYDAVYESAKQWAMNLAQDIINDHNECINEYDDSACEGIYCIDVKYKFNNLADTKRMNNVIFITEGILFSSGYYPFITGRFVEGIAYLKVKVQNMTPEQYKRDIAEEYRINKEDNPKNDLD